MAPREKVDWESVPNSGGRRVAKVQRLAIPRIIYLLLVSIHAIQVRLVLASSHSRRMSFQSRFVVSSDIFSLVLASYTKGNAGQKVLHLRDRRAQSRCYYSEPTGSWKEWMNESINGPSSTYDRLHIRWESEPVCTVHMFARYLLLSSTMAPVHYG